MKPRGKGGGGGGQFLERLEEQKDRLRSPGHREGGEEESTANLNFKRKETRRMRRFALPYLEENKGGEENISI